MIKVEIAIMYYQLMHIVNMPKIKMYLVLNHVMMYYNVLMYFDSYMGEVLYIHLQDQ